MNKIYFTADDVAQMLGVSRGQARLTGYRKIKPNLKNWLYSKLYPHSQIRMFQRFLDTMSQNLESNFTKSE